MTQSVGAFKLNIREKTEELHHTTDEAPIAEFPWKRADVLISTICLNVFALILPVVILQLYDRIIPNQALSTLGILGLGVGIAVVFEALLRVARSYILGWVGQRFDYGANNGVFSHIVGGSVYNINRMGTGEHIENMESLNTIKEFMAGQGFLVLVDLPFMFFFLGLLTYFGGIKLGLGCLVVLVIFVLVAFHVGHVLHAALLKRYELGDRKYNFIIEILRNYFTIKSNSMEEQFLRRFERIQFQASYLEHEVNIASAEARDVGSTFSNILFGVIVTIAGMEVISNQISGGAMAACLFLSNRIIQPLQLALGMWARWQYFQIAKERFHNIFKIPLEENEGIKKEIHGNITFKDISFSYGEEAKVLYDKANIHIRNGEFVTIVGENGTGKTTLTQIMFGNIKPTEGQVLIDETPLEDLNMPDFRRQVAYVAPQGEIFKGTVLENLTFFSQEDQTDRAMSLSTEIGLDIWVCQLPLGYHTPISTHLGMDLPGGILQRLCIVRALLKDPKILILDETNTSLDMQGDRDLMKVLQRIKGEMTIIFITHRPSVSRMADRVFELLDHKIFERKSV